MKLLSEALVKFTCGLILVGLMLFLPAGTINYAGGWLFLGLLFALIPMAFYPVIIIVRLKDEEALLTRELNGYEDYKKKVKYRLVPFVW